MTRSDKLLSVALVSAIGVLLWYGLDGDGLQLRDLGELPATFRSLIP